MLVGINAAMYYGTDIMKKAGISISGMDENESSLVLYIMLSIVSACGTIVAIFLIESLGRRYIILRTVPVIAVSWIVVAAGMSYTGEDRSQDT